MKIRPIEREELAAFARFSDEDDRNAELAVRLAGWWREGASGPQWCFVAEDAGRFVGLPADGSDRELGGRLLRHTLALFRERGVERIAYQLDIPSRTHPAPERQEAVLARLGFVVLREGDRWEWTADTPTPVVGEHLVFRTFGDVGEEAFIDAIARVSEGSLDGWIDHERRRLGPTDAAREYLREAQMLTYRPEWWELAYTGEGALLGLIMMAKNLEVAVVDYIGVVPEQRGHGHGEGLLARGTGRLAAEGAPRIVADPDKKNAPMAGAFERAGYRRFRTRRAYSIALADMQA